MTSCERGLERVQVPNDHTIAFVSSSACKLLSMMVTGSKVGTEYRERVQRGCLLGKQSKARHAILICVCQIDTDTHTKRE